MGLRDIESTLPAGFRFCPSDEELICHYLRSKVANARVFQGLTMVEVDLHTHEPWELPEAARLGEKEWYFFSFRDRKYATGVRANRATRTGYWKATGKDRTVYDPAMRAAVVGMRKTLVFYTGRAPNGSKSNWVMHEFRLETPHAPPKEDWVLCRVFHKKKGESRDYYCGLESERIKENVNDDDNVDIGSSSSPPHLQQQQQQKGRMCYNYPQMSSQFHTVFGLQEKEEEEDEEEGRHKSSTTFLSSALLQHYEFLGGSPQELEKETAAAMGVNCDVGGGDCGMMLDDVGLQEYHDFYGGGILGDFFNGSSSSCSSFQIQGGKEEGHFFYY